MLNVCDFLFCSNALELTDRASVIADAKASRPIVILSSIGSRSVYCHSAGLTLLLLERGRWRWWEFHGTKLYALLLRFDGFTPSPFLRCFEHFLFVSVILIWLSSSRSGWTPEGRIEPGISFCRCRLVRWWLRFFASFDGWSVRWIR